MQHVDMPGSTSWLWKGCCLVCEQLRALVFGAGSLEACLLEAAGLFGGFGAIAEDNCLSTPASGMALPPKKQPFGRNLQLAGWVLK